MGAWAAVMLLSLTGSGDALEADETSISMGFMRRRMADFHGPPRKIAW